MNSAIASIDALIAEQPNNPYFHELKGQALLESARAREAVAPLRHAVGAVERIAAYPHDARPGAGAVGDNSLADEAIGELRQALDTRAERACRLPAARDRLGRKGDRAGADLASAQASFNEGDFDTARQLATRAQRTLAKGTPGWLKAEDIVSYRPPKIEQH